MRLPDLNICGVGHRIVHGGAKFTAPVIIDAACEQDLHQIAHLAPLHNPHNLMGVGLARECLGGTHAMPHVGVFDTAFHSTIAPHIRTYAISKQLREGLGVRQYGFHGISVQHVAGVARALLDSQGSNSGRLVVLHLGAGCSATAVKDGASVDTSMGMTPLDGLVMGTRSGAMDPGAVLYICEALGASVGEVSAMLNKESGLLGLSGWSGDMKSLLEFVLSETTESPKLEASNLALDCFTHRVAKEVASLLPALGAHTAAPLDAIIFTGGIGEHSAEIRKRISASLQWLGVELDHTLNEASRSELVQRAQSPHSPPEEGAAVISPAGSSIKLLVVPTNEELALARATWALVQ